MTTTPTPESVADQVANLWMDGHNETAIAVIRSYGASRASEARREAEAKALETIGRIILAAGGEVRVTMRELKLLPQELVVERTILPDFSYGEIWTAAIRFLPDKPETAGGGE